MENINLNVGGILVDQNTKARYRILYIKNEFVVLCQMDISKLDIQMVPASKLVDGILSGTITQEPQSTCVYDYEKLTVKQRADYDRRCEVIHAIVDVYGPIFLGLAGKETKQEIHDILNRYSLSKSTLFRWIRIFLQSGMDYNSLINATAKPHANHALYKYKNKTGKRSECGVTFGIPLTPDVISHFEEALSQYKSGRMMSYNKAYNYMINKHYTTVSVTEDGIHYQPFPATERPTFRQFQYYVRKTLTTKERDIIKTSAMEVRNNNRLLLSDVMYGVQGPCDRVQMDECEVDLSLVSSINENQSIGRPIVYAMIDVYTRMILAVGVAFDNNSIIGMTNCFLNLAEDKVEYCEKYGISISEKQWPSGYLPNRILVDRGSEYVSKESSRIFNEIQVSRELVPAGTGSLKGSIEQWFHQLQSSQNAALEHHGQISKRHDSKHHKESCLTLDEFTRILINFVVYHNTHIIKNYPLEPEMIATNMNATPIELWEFGCAKYGMPRKITNLSQYCYSLMLPQKATIDRRGITCNGLFYINMSDDALLTEMYNQQNKRGKFECRIDPRDVGSIYYLREDQLLAAPLNSLKFGNAAFAGLTLAEWTTIRNFLSQKKREQIITAGEHKAYLERMNDMIVSNAVKNVPSDITEMTKHRTFEKHFIQNRNSMYFMLCDQLKESLSEAPNLPEIDETVDTLIDDTIVDSDTVNECPDDSNDITEDTHTISDKTLEDVTLEEIRAAIEAFNLRNYGM